LPKESGIYDEIGIKRNKRKLCPDEFERAFCPLTHTQATNSKPV